LTGTIPSELRDLGTLEYLSLCKCLYCWDPIVYCRLTFHDCAQQRHDSQQPFDRNHSLGNRRSHSFEISYFWGHCLYLFAR